MQYIERGKNGEPDIVYTEEEWQKKNRFNGCMAMIVAVGFILLCILGANMKENEKDESPVLQPVETQADVQQSLNENVAAEHKTMYDNVMSAERTVAEPLAEQNSVSMPAEECPAASIDSIDPVPEDKEEIDHGKKLSRKERRAMRKAKRKAEKERKREERNR